ncbi:transposase [Streptomyces asoensis]|uniref:Transposase n=1 Tax=Streptomyces asoensis TaxID=249586 RepID=A0A6M4X4V5_9ACTN|nr:transposase [Streptomyces asoensis]
MARLRTGCGPAVQGRKAHLRAAPLHWGTLRGAGAAQFKGEGLSPVLTPGQRADCTQFEAVMERIRVPRLATGRPRTTPDSVRADKVYSNRRTRAYLRGRGIRHVIPNKLKQFRAVATRYDKRAYVYLGTVTATALVIRLRS